MLVLTYAMFVNSSLLQNIELKLFDNLIVQDKLPVDDVVLIDIGERSLDRYGQYPFPRDYYADLISRLREANAGVIAFNMSFPEEDRTGQDELFKRALQQGVVISHFPSEKTVGRAAYTTGIIEVGERALPYVPHYSGISANIPEYEALAGGIGIANTLPEIDGVVRRLPMISAVDETLYPSIVLEVLKLYMETNTYQIKTDPLGVNAVRVKGFPTITTDANARIWINPNFTFKHYDMVDEFPDLNGATVFVGVTAEGISNPVPTAVGSVSGHEITAKAYTSIVNGYNIVTPPLADLYKLLTMLGIGCIIIGLSYTRGGWAIGLIAIGVAGYFPVYAFTNWFELYNTAVPALLSIIIFAHVYGVKYGQEFFAKMQIKKQFGTYLSPAMVEKLSKNPELLQLGGETRELSIMFTDVRGFTAISEHYGKDVQGLVGIMNRYMTAMTKTIINNDGTLDKYIGDAQMAFWNAPLDDKDHALNAVRTALIMLNDLEEFNNDIKKEGIPEFGMGLGINTADVVVGNMGSVQRFDYTCLGDGVNLASRLEGQSKPYRVKMIIGPRTADLVRDVYDVCELDCIAVKGKTEGVKIYTVVKETQEHRNFLKCYYDGDWKKAEILLGIANNKGTHLLGYYGAMLTRLREGKPADWDGTFRATSK